jgi:hypothetical protein
LASYIPDRKTRPRGVACKFWRGYAAKAFARRMLVSRATGGNPARLAPLTAEIISSKVDLIIAVGPGVLRTFWSATVSIPIVAMDLLQQLKPFRAELRKIHEKSGDVTAGMRKTFYPAVFDRVTL